MSRKSLRKPTTPASPAHAAASVIAACYEGLVAAVVYDLDGLDVEPDWVGEIAHDFPGTNGAVQRRGTDQSSLMAWRPC